MSVRWLLFALASCMTLCSCGPLSGEVPVQVVAPHESSTSKFSLKVVRLPRIIDIHALKGERLIFRAGTNVPWSDYLGNIEEKDTFESARDSFLGMVPFEAAAPRLAWNGDYFKAVDFDSLYLVTAYYWFEQVWDFFKDVVQDCSDATKTPVMVSVYSAFTSKGLIRIPTGFADNSAYQPLEDMFKMYRVGDQEGLPFEMNPGVIAHEFHHRIFQHLVFRAKGKAGFATWLDLTGTRSSLKYARARQLLRATDEGLSDIHAVAFSRNPDFLGLSLVRNDDSDDGMRNLEGHFAQVATYDNLANSTLSVKLLGRCNGESVNFSNPQWNYYCLGTVIAKTIWETADQNVDILRSEILPRINRVLVKLGDRLLGQLEQYDLNVFWEELAQTIEPSRKARLCEQIRNRFQSIYSRVSSCA